MTIAKILYYLSLPIVFIGGNFLSKNLWVAIPLIVISVGMFIIGLILERRKDWTKWRLEQAGVVEIRTDFNPILGFEKETAVVSDHYARLNKRTGEIQRKRVN